MIGVPEKEEKKKGYEKIFEEIIVENFPNTEKEIIKSKRHRVPYRINPRRNMPRYILIKLIKTKHKERILKAAREKQQVTYKRNPKGLTADLSAETPQARREWQPTPVFLPRESQGERSLVGCSLWGCTELDMTETN